jgi:hypothetical protein
MTNGGPEIPAADATAITSAAHWSKLYRSRQSLSPWPEMLRAATRKPSDRRNGPM